MKLKTLEDDGEQFDVSVHESDENSPVVLLLWALEACLIDTVRF